MKPPKIMLATDLSARCDRPMDRAVALARETGGTLVVAHVIEGRPRGEPDLYRGLVEALIAGHFDATDIAVETAILHGSPAKALAEAAEERGCALIVTGIARFDSLKDHILGTTVDHLVRHAAMPVLVVKTRPADPYRRLLVATDLSPCSRHALEVAAALFPAARLDVVHAYHVSYGALLSSEQVAGDVRREAEEELAAFVSSANLSEDAAARIDAHAVSGELAEVIDGKIARDRPDLVVLGTHGKSGFVHATLGSRAAELLGWIPCDVMMVREPR